MADSRGVTLVELLVVLVILGTLMAISALAIGSVTSPPHDARAVSLQRARLEAIASGHTVILSDSLGVIRILPDGRGIGPRIDALTGEADNGMR